ncbi:hypothetical protein B296_00043816, partial [Ensete ventricosum]
PSLAGATLAAAPTGWPQSVAPVGGHPLRAVAPAGDRPLQVASSPLVGGPWLQLVTPARGVGRGQPPPFRGPWP